MFQANVPFGSPTFGPALSGLPNLTATGTNLQTATLISAADSIFRHVAPGTGCRLPAPDNQSRTIYNYSTNVLLIYPAFGDQIAMLGVGVAIALSPNNAMTFSSFDSALTVPPRLWIVITGSGNNNASGDVLGPAVAVNGDVAIFGGTSGTVIADSGILVSAIVQGPTTATVGDVVVFSNTHGTVVADTGIPSARLVQGPTVSVVGDVAAFSNVGGTGVSDSGVGFANIVQNTGGTVASGDLVSFSGTTGRSIQDSGISFAGGTLVVPGTIKEGSFVVGSNVPTILDLEAATSTTLPAAYCFVAGYRLQGDGGEGWFCVATPTTANGGTIINDASGRTWFRLSGSAPVCFEWFGAYGDGTHDDTTAVQAAITWVQGTVAYIQAKARVYLLSSTINITSPVTLIGSGNGSGPGVVVTTGATVFLCAGGFTTGDVFAASGNDSFIFRDFQIAGATGLAYTSACPRTTGAGIHISGPISTTNMGSVVDHVAFSGLFVGLQLTRCQENTLTNTCYFQAWGASAQAFFADNGATSVESSYGQVTNCQFFGNPGGSQSSCADVHCGYGGFHHNKFLGAEIGLRVFADQVSIGNLVVDSGNSFEENATQSILVTQVGSTIITSVKIIGNQFSNITNEALTAHISIAPELGGAASDIYDVQVIANTFNTQTTGSSPSFISVNATNVLVAHNVGAVVGGTSNGINVIASSGATSVLDNQIITSGGAFSNTGGYLLQSATLFRDLRDGIFNAAALSGLSSCTNGSEVYVTDGQATGTTNFTVIGSGSGCMALRQRGAWLAPGGLTG